MPYGLAFIARDAEKGEHRLYLTELHSKKPNLRAVEGIPPPACLAVYSEELFLGNEEDGHITVLPGKTKIETEFPAVLDLVRTQEDVLAAGFWPRSKNDKEYPCGIIYGVTEEKPIVHTGTGVVPVALSYSFANKETYVGVNRKGSNKICYIDPVSKTLEKKINLPGRKRMWKMRTTKGRFLETSSEKGVRIWTRGENDKMSGEEILPGTEGLAKRRKIMALYVRHGSDTIYFGGEWDGIGISELNGNERSTGTILKEYGISGVQDITGLNEITFCKVANHAKKVKL